TINEIINHCELFDLRKGRVIHCHIIRQSRPNEYLSSKDDDKLTKDDLILFNIHHSAFDGTSISIFLRDFSLAYETDCSLPLDNDGLQYIDYSVYERQMDMTFSSDFWQSQLHGYNFECRLSLPTDRQRSSSDQRSGLASIAQISFDEDISTAFLDYASAHKVTPFQLGLATFYAFLFKISHGQSDLCIACLNANRYKSELQNIIGMFVATLPYRIQLDSNWSFDELVKHVQEKSLSVLEHSHYPLQYILADSHISQLNASFLETVFNFLTVPSDMAHLSLNGATLEQVSLDPSWEVAKFDFMLTFIYNPSLNDRRLSCHFICSHDLYDVSTIEKIAQRFQHIFFQLFSSKSSASQINQSFTAIKKLSLILPNEAQEMQGTIFYRLPNIVNEGMFIYFLLYFNVGDIP
ncbi:unnamed protein product, partial [Rotaria sp. Silwood1]